MSFFAGIVLGLSLAVISLAILVGRRFDRHLGGTGSSPPPRITRPVDLSNLRPRKHLTGSPRVALIVDGPLAGLVHEVWAPGGVLPDVIAFPVAEDDPTRHFYRLDEDGGLRFLRTEEGANP